MFLLLPLVEFLGTFEQGGCRETCAYDCAESGVVDGGHDERR